VPGAEVIQLEAVRAGTDGQSILEGSRRKARRRREHRPHPAHVCGGALVRDDLDFAFCGCDIAGDVVAGTRGIDDGRNRQCGRRFTSSAIASPHQGLGPLVSITTASVDLTNTTVFALPPVTRNRFGRSF
jgi:hypothetical protein